MFRIGKDWGPLLSSEYTQPYFKSLEGFIASEYLKNKCFPPKDQIFNAFNLCAFKDLKAVLIGQDPYHGMGQANGLAFSVNSGVPIPPSLKNIFKELERDLELPTPKNGDLSNWASQGVLLLNATLTVEQGNAGAHQGRGWEEFTDRAIHELNARRDGLVFLLWGSYAQKKGAFIDRSRHLVLKAPHPSPLSAYRGFFGCQHFSKANEYLRQHGKNPIDWQLPATVSPDQMKPETSIG